MGGSFNPVHAGHILLADYLVQFGGLDGVWLMLSPQNPLKSSVAPVPDDMRLDMLRLACRDVPGLSSCDVELSMPRPNYTIDSLRRLARENPGCELHLVIGSDNWLIFDRWRESEALIKDFRPVIYPRPGYDVDSDSLPEGVRLVKAPVFDISSTFIREAIATGHDMGLYLPCGVGDYIKRNKLYRQ